jgi:L-alanine-DL-glutamate epimerase-like enolase superfamily enzyme
MSATAALSRPPLGASVESLRARAYRVPTATEQESDGTLSWQHTDVVLVEVCCAEHVGLGYTYCHPAAALLIGEKLAPLVEGADALMPERCFALMAREIRQLGHAGVAAMALSAVDIALWDLKARLLGLSLADALPRWRESVPVYGSGGFTNYAPEQLREQVRGWLELGISKIKIKVGREKDADLQRLQLVRDLTGDGVELMVDGNRAYTLRDALLWAERFAGLGARWFEEPLSSEDLDGLAELRRSAPAGLRIAAGEYGWDLPYFARTLLAGSVDVLQADVTRCGGVSNMVRLDGLCKAFQLPFSAHCAPAISAHVCCAMESAAHIEYFFDHSRIEQLLFEGAAHPRDGALSPDRCAAGLGLVLRAEQAARYELSLEASA